MNETIKNLSDVRRQDDVLPVLMREVEDKIVEVRGQKTLLDFHVAALYGVETREVNQAVRNNPRKFREGYVLELTKEESAALRSKFSTIEKTSSTLDSLRSNNLTLETAGGKGRHSKYNFKAFTRKGVLTDIVMPELETRETESSMEINFLVGKIKHTVKRVRK